MKTIDELRQELHEAVEFIIHLMIGNSKGSDEKVKEDILTMRTRIKILKWQIKKIQKNENKSN